MKELVYISGRISAPVKAIENINIIRMTDAAAEVAQERVVFHPGLNFGKIGERLGWEWKDYMRQDLEILKRCDTIFMVDGWKESRGARMEHWLAKRWGKKIEYQEPQLPTSVRKPYVSEYWYYEDEI